MKVPADESGYTAIMPSLCVALWSGGRRLALGGQEVPGSSPGYARSKLSPWKRLFTCIFSPYSCVKRVLDYMQYSRVTRHLE